MIKRLLPYLRGYRLQAVMAPLWVSIETVCELILPLLMAAIIDDGIQKGDMGAIGKNGALMVLVSMLSLAGGILAARFAAQAAQGLGANIRKAEFEQISAFSFGDIDRFSTASLVTRLTNDVTQIQNMVSMCLRMLVRSAVMMLVAIIVACSISVKLAGYVLIILPLVVLIVGGMMRMVGPLFGIMQKKLDGLNQVIQENLIGTRVVKAFVRQDYERGKFKRANDELTQAGLNAILRILAMMPLMMLGMNLATVLILYNGGHMVLGGELEIGQLSSILTYIFNILFSVMMVGFALLSYTRAKASAGRIFAVLDTVPAIADGPERESETGRGLVEFRDVSFKYAAGGTGDDVLRHISFTALPGQTVAIVGGTGSGKSTLVNLIPRFYDVTAGQVLVDGRDVRDYRLDDLRGRIGMVLQNNILFSGTIRENLLWGKRDATEEEMIQAAKNAQAYDFIMSFPDGFDTRLEQGGVNVSGGQKQRLCIARAMLRHPEVLILDDSTSAVDSTTEGLIRQSFAENLKDTTVILIAQRISSVRTADRILVLEDDTIVASGTHDELMETSRVYQEIYYSQQEGVKDNG